MNPSNSAEDIVTKFGYDANNRRTTLIDPRGFTTTTSYSLYDFLGSHTFTDGTQELFSYYKDGLIDNTYTISNTGVSQFRQYFFYDGYGKATRTIIYSGSSFAS